MTLENLKKSILQMKNKGKSYSSYSEYKIICALRIKKLVLKRLLLPEDNYTGKISFKFLIYLSGIKKDFDIDAIKLDIINKVPIEEIALMYKEPIEVILEIKEKINIKSPFIVTSKIYNSSELAKHFNKVNTDSITNSKYLQSLSEKSTNEIILWWSGKKINDNYQAIANLFKNGYITIDNEKCIDILEASKILDISFYTVRNRVTKKQKIFGIILDSIRVDKEGFNQQKIYLSLEKVLLAKKKIKNII